MFDLSKIKFINKNADRSKRAFSFVGIRKNPTTGEIEFWLPLGFEEFDKGDFNQVKSFFFGMYKTFKKYLSDKSLEKELLDNNRDGLYDTAEGGFRFTNFANDDLLLYSKLNAFDKIIEGYDDLRIASLERKATRTLVVDYSQIHKYLHKAVYLEDDVIYVDEMSLPKNVIVKSSTPIIELFSYIYMELKRELDESSDLTPHAIELAESFKEEYLSGIGSLFDQFTFEDTISILKERLNEVDLYTTYKDDDYWHFFEAVESFLYAENDFENTDDIYWGIKDFSDIWETMCQNYCLDLFENVLYAEVGNYLKKYLPLDGEPFKMTMSSAPNFRYIRPDLVLLDEIKYNKGAVFLRKNYSIKEIPIPNTQLINYYVHFSPIIENHFPKIIHLYEEYCYKYSKKYRETGDDFYKNLSRSNLKAFEQEAQVLLNDQYQLELLKSTNREFASIAVNIVDYKYMAVQDYIDYDETALNYEGENKIRTDIQKQLVYEYAFQQNYLNSLTRSEFWIPGVLANNELKKEVPIKNLSFNKSQILLIQINFKMVQEHYLKS